MTGFIETQREALEELNIIEESITKRFQRDPHLLPASLRPKLDIISKTKPKRRQTLHLSLLQQWELRAFIDKYEKNCKSLSFCLESEKELFQQELSKLKEGPNQFSKFDKLIEEMGNKNNSETSSEDMRRLYASYSSATLNKNTYPSTDFKIKVNKTTGKEKEMTKRKHVLSSVCSHLTSSVTTEGYLNLSALHQQYNSNVTVEQVSYIQYLHTFHTLTSSYKNREYSNYIKDLSDELLNSWKTLHPLTDINTTYASWKREFEENSSTGVSKENETGEVFCHVCNKLFAKQTVYNGHLNGKKHKSNLRKLQAPPSSSSQTHDHMSPAWDEFVISKLLFILQPELERTRVHEEKLANSSERELIVDRKENEEIESDYTCISENSDLSDQNNSDEDEGYEGFKNLPLGPDGTPIPFWLYKLQGLHKTYNCEICGNVTYKGKQPFFKHFNGVKHQYGLKCLGVEEEYIKLFKNIVSIDEAKELWMRFKKEKRSRDGELENAVEVEDDEGNVMSEKDYLDLKRQGLL